MHPPGCAGDPGTAPPPDPGARRSLRARLAAGPAGRAIAHADLWLYRRVRSSASDDGVVRAVSAYSRLGEHAGVWLVLGAVGGALDRPRRGRWWHGARTVLGAYLLNTALKAVARRSRPALEDLPALIRTPTALSFPSAHASSSFAAARAYSALLPAAPLYAAASAMAASRVFLGVHYPSDIAVGALLGTAVGSVGR